MKDTDIDQEQLRCAKFEDFRNLHSCLLESFPLHGNFFSIFVYYSCLSYKASVSEEFVCITRHIQQSSSEKINFLYFSVNAVDFTKNVVLNIRTILFETGIHGYLNFWKLAHVAFCKQTLQVH